MTAPNLHPVVAEAAAHGLIDVAHIEELSAQLDAVRLAWPEDLRIHLLGHTLQVELNLREVRIAMQVSLTQWPAHPPELRVTNGPWYHPYLFEDRVLELQAMSRWNRTVTLDQLARELEGQLLRRPPQRRFSLSVLARRVWRQLRR